MTSSRLWGCVLVLGLFGGCATKAGGARGDTEERREELGGLTEKQFQALHELKTGAPPPRKGLRVEVAGARAYLSLPEHARVPVPGVLVIHEWWGLNEHIMHWADRLAAQGYAALAVDLYGGKVATTPEEAMALMKTVDSQRSLEILRAAHDFLVTDARVQSSRTGVVGWCFGGGWSLQAGLALPELDAVVMYYGRPITDVQKLKALHAPLLGIFGTKDESIPPPVVEEFDKALTSAGVVHKVLSYEAPHAFANPSAPERYNAEAATAAWEQVHMFLAEHLKK